MAVDNELVHAPTERADNEVCAGNSTQARSLATQANAVDVHGQVRAVVSDLSEMPLPICDVVRGRESPTGRCCSKDELGAVAQDLPVEQRPEPARVAVDREILSR